MTSTPSSPSRSSDDARALERYRYLVRTAAPEDLERTHAEAFARLTPEQRRQLLSALADEATPAEASRLTDDPGSLARAATRAEMRSPGTVERMLRSRGLEGRSVLAGVLAGLAGAVVGSVLIDGLVDTGFGDGGLIDLAHDRGGPGGWGGFGDFGDLF